MPTYYFVCLPYHLLIREGSLAVYGYLQFGLIGEGRASAIQSTNEMQFDVHYPFLKNEVYSGEMVNRKECT